MTSKGVIPPLKTFLFFTFQEYYTNFWKSYNILRLRSSFALPPLYLRYRSVPSPFQNRYKAVPYNGRKMGVTREVHRTCLGSRVNLLFLTLWERNAACFINNSITVKWHILEVAINILDDFKICVCSVCFLIVEWLDWNTIFMLKYCVEKRSVRVTTRMPHDVNLERSTINKS